LRSLARDRESSLKIHSAGRPEETLKFAKHRTPSLERSAEVNEGDRKCKGGLAVHDSGETLTDT